MNACVRCGVEFLGTDLLVREGAGFRHCTYCPAEHRAWLERFKAYQAEFNELIWRSA